MNKEGQLYAGAAAQQSNYNKSEMGYGRDPGAENRQSEIPRYCEELAKHLDVCSEGMDRLEGKLESVTSAELPAPGVGLASPVAVPQSDMGHRLQDMSGQVASINARIHSLLRRLEV